jgi:hypothetical protein
LEEFKQCQDQKIAWDVLLGEQYYTMHFVTRILFIIGDSEGHDKLASRYLCRNKVQKLCRYCDCPYDETSNPYYKFTYNKHKPMFDYISQYNTKSLKIKELSCYKIDNAFRYLKFCDSKRGLFGSLCSDILHCIQLGLFKYFFDKLFDQNKESKVSKKLRKNNTELMDVPDIIYNQFKVFSATYSKEFNKLVKKYGKMLSRQSDRDLPRTNVNTDIQSNAKKNGHEMSGVLIILLIIFSSSEGTTVLDGKMAAEQSTNLIHLIELLLMLENFCQSDIHTKTELYKFQEFIPLLLDKFKEVVDRKKGTGFNFIKFHLPIHFVDDINRFGVMKNFDSSIGESHHKIDAKRPGKNTQKRKDLFELQTATRQLENLTISICFDSIKKSHYDISEISNKIKDDDESKWYRYVYNTEKGLCYHKKNSKKSVLLQCVWKDNSFQNLLISFSKKLINTNKLNGNLNFFSQFNRDKYIFRADPNYENNIPWHDWAEINWANDGILPAKLLLFIDISPQQFLGKIIFEKIVIDKPGKYAIIQSMFHIKDLTQAHQISWLVQYGKFNIEENPIYIVPVESIHGPISAVPYLVEDSIITANEWLFLRPKSEWYKIFFNLINKNISKTCKIDNKKRKRS